MKKRVISILLVCFFLLICGCSGTVTVDSTVTQDAKFGAAVIDLSQEEFESAGFELGDSVDVEFGNGLSIKDIPYYNGYYVKNEFPVLIAYPGFDKIRVTYNNLGIWNVAALEENLKITISLNTKQKYSAIQESLGQIYSFERNKYESDEQFSNFRALSGGNLKENYLFRGASPVDNSRNRAPYTDRLLKESNIGFVIDLADSEEDIQGYFTADDFTSEYTKSLYDEGCVVLLDMGSGYQSEEYRQKFVSGLKAMLEYEDVPVFIHCMEGKDRTGFVCMLLEALAGATYDEMLTDYMITYENYFSVTKDKTPEKYEAIADLYFNSFVEYLHGTSDLDTLKSADYTEDAKAYLRAGGMTDEEIQTLIERISNH